MNKKFLNDSLFLGIDGGGSKCRATIVTADGEFLGTGLGGPANPFQDTQQAIESILTSTDQALVSAGLTPTEVGRLVAGIGLAGVNLPRFYRIMNDWAHPFRHLFMATDLHIACLGAHGGADGAVIVAGTGSCGYLHIGGNTLICGAHGFPFGDKGSGAWIGLEAIKAVLLASDGLGPTTALQEAICASLQTDTLGVIEHLAGATSRRYAQLAPLVLTAATEGDTVARSIIEQGAAYLDSVANKLHAAQPPRISLLGGLGEHIMPWLDPAVRARFSPPLQEPDRGATLYARAQWQSLQNPEALPV